MRLSGTTWRGIQWMAHCPFSTHARRWWGEICGSSHIPKEASNGDPHHFPPVGSIWRSEIFHCYCNWRKKPSYRSLGPMQWELNRSKLNLNSLGTKLQAPSRVKSQHSLESAYQKKKKKEKKTCILLIFFPHSFTKFESRAKLLNCTKRQVGPISSSPDAKERMKLHNT